MEFVKLIISYVNAAGHIAACLILIDDTMVLQCNGNYIILSKNCEFQYCGMYDLNNKKKVFLIEIVMLLSKMSGDIFPSGGKCHKGKFFVNIL